MGPRLQLTSEGAKFLTVGGVATLVGMAVSYRGNRWWAFRHREAVGVAGGRLSFFAINIVSLMIPMLCLAISRYALDFDDAVADNLSANVIGLGLGAVARFWPFRKFIFLGPDKARAPQTS